MSVERTSLGLSVPGELFGSGGLITGQRRDRRPRPVNVTIIPSPEGVRSHVSDSSDRQAMERLARELSR